MIRNRTLAGVLTAIALGVLISGCALFGEAAEKIAVGVEKYCEQPYLYRSDFRNTVNAQLTDTGHKVHVHCAGDPDATTSTPSADSILAGLTFTVQNIEVNDYATPEKGTISETKSRVKTEHQEGARSTEKERPQET